MIADSTPLQPTEDEPGITCHTRIRNNDPRRRDRALEVTGFEGDFVFAAIPAGRGRRLARIRQVHIHTDGKPRKTGWNLVP